MRHVHETYTRKTDEHRHKLLSESYSPAPCLLREPAVILASMTRRRNTNPHKKKRKKRITMVMIIEAFVR